MSETRAVSVEPNTIPVPTEYASLGASSAYAPKAPDDLKIVLVGFSGSGKTTFAASVPNSIVLDFEAAHSQIPTEQRRNFYISLRNQEHYKAVRDKLLRDAKDKHRPVRRIIIDTVDTWTDWLSADLTREKGCEAIEEIGREGTGYSMLRRRVLHDLDLFEQAGYSWLICAHLKTERKTGPDGKEVTRIRESMAPSLAERITSRAEYVLTAYFYTETVQVQKQVKLADGRTINAPETKTINRYSLLTIGSVERPGKARIQLPEDEILLPKIGGWELFRDVYLKASGQTGSQ